MTSEKNKSMTERLLKLDSGAISDVLDGMGLPHQVLATEIKPVSPNTRIAGPVYCIRGVTAAPDSPVAKAAGNTAFQVDRNMREGCIAVIATGGHREGAIIGGNVSQSYVNHGCRGAVVDGPVRDVADFSEQKFGVFAASLSPMSSKGRFVFASFDQPIEMPGHGCTHVTVDPSDYIIADDEGCAVIPGRLIEQVVDAAEKLVAVEARMMGLLKQGTDREVVYKDNNPRAHIAKVV